MTEYRWCYFDGYGQKITGVIEASTLKDASLYAKLAIKLRGPLRSFVVVKSDDI